MTHPKISPVTARSARAWQRRAAGSGLALALAVASAGAGAATCSMSTPGVAFGPYDVFAAAAIFSTGTLTLTCSFDPSTDTGNTKIDYTIALSTGSSSTFVQRTMKSGTNTLGYNLYTSNTYALVWGDGTGSTVTQTGTLTVNPGHPTDNNVRTVYGRVPALQDAAVAPDYRDNVTITVTW